MNTGPFHYLMLLKNGKKIQIEKCIEEIRELSEAIKEGEREHIVEEMSDVENIIPYITIVFGFKLKPIRRLTCENPLSLKILARLLTLTLGHSTGNYHLFRGIVRDLVHLYLSRLIEIKAEYQITQQEIDSWKEMKREKYTMMTLFGKQ